jgi:hypothetical protein
VEKKGLLRKTCYTEKKQEKSCRTKTAEEDEKNADENKKKILILKNKNIPKTPLL